jgi:hypothetical protein
MSTAKLHIVSPQEPPQRLNWSRGVHVTGVILWWLLTFLWGLAKAMVIVLAFTVGVVLIVIGIMADFVGGPPR